MEPKPRSPVMGCATKQLFCFTSNDVWSMSLVTSTLICFSEILAPPCPSWAHVLSEIRYELEIKSFFSSEMLKNILQIMRIIPSKDAKASSSKQIITCGPDWTIQHWVIVFRIFSVSKWFRISWLDLAMESCYIYREGYSDSNQ